MSLTTFRYDARWSGGRERCAGGTRRRGFVLLYYNICILLFLFFA